MTWIPIGIFIAGIALAIAFEFGYAFITKKVILISSSKEIYLLIYWAAIWLLGILCHVIPVPPAFTAKWGALVFVMLAHLFLSTELYGVPFRGSSGYFSGHVSKKGTPSHSQNSSNANKHDSDRE